MSTITKTKGQKRTYEDDSDEYTPPAKVPKTNATTRMDKNKPKKAYSEDKSSPKEGSLNKGPAEANAGLLELPGGRMVRKAEWVILNQYSPPKYPNMYDNEGQLLTDEAECRKHYMELGCANAFDWLKNAGA
jgi:hypothetical protein